MKENITNLVGRITKWLMLAIAIALVGQTARAGIVFSNATTRATDGGNPLYLSQTSGYQFGDEVVLSPATNAYITNFTFEYYGLGLSGAMATLRIYANNGTNYGPTFKVPGDLLYDSGPFSIGDGVSGGFGTVTVNSVNTPGFGVPVASNFTWTVEFSGVGLGTAGLAMYDPANTPVVGSDYAGYWEQNVSTSAWAWRVSTNLNYNFGAVVKATAADTKIPTIILTGPKTGYRTDPAALTNGIITVTGTAKDDRQVESVLYKLNLGSFQPATITSGLSGNTNWTVVLAPPNLLVGDNTVTVKALDRTGNESKSLVMKYTFVVTNACTLTFAAGTNSGTTKGIVTMTGAASTVTNLEIGKTYALQIKENMDPITKLVTHYYSNTVISSVLGTTVQPSSTFTFVMQTNTSLLINCLTNRFAGIAGEYNGLIGATFGDDVTNQVSSGFVTLKVLGTRKFSGRMSIAGEILAIAGQFDLSGNATNIGAKVVSGTSKIVTTKKQVLTNSVRLTMNFGVSPTVSGTLSNNISGAVTTLIADKYSWGTNNPATNYSGNYTMVVPSSLANPNGPSGYSFASVIIDSNGLITMKGLTADGQALVQKVKLSKDGNWPLFAANSLDTAAVSPITLLPNKLKKGSVIGWLTVAPNASNDVNRVSGELKWIRTANSSALYYPAGFTNISEAIANRYVCNKAGTPPKYINAVVGLTGGAGYLKISDGGLSSTNLAVTEFTNATMKVVVGPSKKAPLLATVTTLGASGNVNGSFFTYPTPGLKSVKFFGIALQTEAKAYGFFNNDNGFQSGKIVVE